MELLFTFFGACIFLGMMVSVFLVISALISGISLAVFSSVLFLAALLKVKIQYLKPFLVLLIPFFIMNGYAAFYIGEHYLSFNTMLSAILAILSSVWFIIYIYLNIPVILSFEPQLEKIQNSYRSQQLSEEELSVQLEIKGIRRLGKLTNPYRLSEDELEAK